MRCEWIIEQTDVERLHDFLAKWNSSALVLERENRNVKRNIPALSRDHVWQVLVACLLTSVQRSGPDSAVSRFLSVSPFPLRLEECHHRSDLLEFAQGVLQRFGGIRFTTKIPEQLEQNISIVCDDGKWATVESCLQGLTGQPSLGEEREVADYLAESIHGFGPKQSRNFLQILGLSRFVVPLDSRVTKWLNDFGFPVELSGSMLSDRHYYEFVEDGLQELCVPQTWFHVYSMPQCLLVLMRSSGLPRWRCGDLRVTARRY